MITLKHALEFIQQRQEEYKEFTFISMRRNGKGWTIYTTRKVN